MRGILKIVILAAAVTSPAFSFGQSEKEKEAIKNVIIKETFSFMNVDHATWADTWAHTTYAYSAFADSTGSNFVNGWAAIDKAYEQYFKMQKPSKAKITEDWIEIRLYGMGAYVRFTQRMQDDIDAEETSQVRVLEKIGGKWKIVHVGVTAVYK